MNPTRRLFLAGASLIAVNLVARAAFAQDAAVAPDAASPDVIGDILKSDRRGNWSDDFDAQASQGEKVASKLPIFSPMTVVYLEQAIGQYQQIVMQGGWPLVPATKKLKLGVIDPDVETLRKRLMVSGDLSPRAGMSQSYDTYVDAAVKRFQARHGLPADGVMGKYTYAALNIQRAGAPRPARDQPRQAALDVRLPRRPLCHGEHSGGPDRGGRERPRRAAPHGNRRQDRPADPDRQFQDQRDHRQSLLERAGIDRAQGHNSADAEGPGVLSKNNIHILGPDGIEIDPTTIDWNTEDAAKYRLRQDPGSGNAMASVKINFPSPDGVYMHDTPQQSLFSKLMRFEFVGLRARAERARPRDLAAARHARLDPPAFRADHQERREHAGRDRRCRCRSISPTSRPGRLATASCSSATTSMVAMASTSCRSRRRRSEFLKSPAQKAIRSPPLRRERLRLCVGQR